MRWGGAALAGLTLAGAASRPAPLLVVVLLGLALAAERWLLVALAVGLLAAWWQPPAVAPAAGRPVVLEGVLERPWRRAEDGWLGSLRVRHYRQGLRVEPWRERVTLHAPGPEPPAAGAAVRVRGLLRRAPALANVPGLEPGPWSLRLKSRRFLDSAPARWSDAWWRAGGRARERIEGVMRRVGRRPGMPLARALVLGDPSRLPPRWRRGLRAAGVAHLVALSGLHVGLLAGCFLLAGALLPRGVAPAAGVLATVGFLLLAGGRPALLRAVCMGVLAAAGLALGRRPHGPSLLATLAAGLALRDPALLDDLGFRLTCSATAGILWLSPRFARAWPALPGWLRRPLAVTAGAQLASLPWALPAFKLLTPLAAGWNLAAVPWTAGVLTACLAWSVLALTWPAAAVWSAPALDPGAWLFAALAALPPSITRPLPLVLSVWGAALLAAALAIVLLRPAKRWVWGTLALAVLLARGAAAPPAGIELRMLDVGQGEALLLRDGTTALLVDGGGWRYGDLGGRLVMPALAAAGVRRLDALVLSHPDLDHCGGLVDLTSYLPVAEIWTAPGWRGRPCAAELLATPGTRLRLLWAGERSAAGRWRFVALHPRAGDRRGGNDRSLVLAAAAPGLRALLTGDIGVRTEASLVRRWPAATLRADLLKIAHHGSAGSTSAALLQAVRPRLALLSCGRGNRYGHPAPAVTRRIHGAGLPILRTDRSGQIVVRATGKGLRLATPGVPHLD